MKIVHVISGLNQGGAEKALYKLITHKEDTKFIIISLGSEGIYEKQFTYHNNIQLPLKKIQLVNLELKSGIIKFIKGLVKLFMLLKNEKPDVVQTWMYHADLLAGIIAKLAGVKKIYWTIVSYDLSSNLIGIRTAFIARLCAIFSYFIPEKIIVVAKSSIRTHNNIGYKKNIYTYIPIGFEIPNFDLNSNNFTDLNLIKMINDNRKKNKLIIGSVARWDPQKNHKLLIKAISILQKNKCNFFCIFVGTNINIKNLELMKLLKKYKVSENNYILIDHVDSIDELMINLDIFVLSSITEAFPNVLGEAMSNGIPCIATEVGDCKVIINKTGWMIASNNASQLYKTIINVLNLIKDKNNWQSRKNDCILQIKNNFSVEKMYRKYKEIWSS